MKYVVECKIEDFMPWSGAVYTYRKIEEAGLLDELEALIEEAFCEELPTATTINDFLWFDDVFIYETLGLDENGDIKEEEEEEEEEEENN